ncbi:hypothetical protein Cci01nite_40700 [Catellatospora citrea]|uniref:Uncharacterized protein n=1 Tax=Catellatospora citrea TaxID=53366 RepID=A0A8J3K980_9ACTN|nr:hypothetical protein Cci01nite_40700 [Catellatospora citrea]
MAGTGIGTGGTTFGSEPMHYAAWDCTPINPPHEWSALRRRRGGTQPPSTEPGGDAQSRQRGDDGSDLHRTALGQAARREGGRARTSHAAAAH